MEKHKWRYFEDFFKKETPKKSEKDLANLIEAKEK
jgi:hypothetical protein